MLRKEYLARRNALSLATYQAYNDRIQALFFSYFTLERGQKIHIYLASQQKREVATAPIIHTLQQGPQDIVVVVPKVVRDIYMESYQLEIDTLLQENRWGIQEPMGGVLVKEGALDWVIIPLIIFDKRGYRVGYGKGHYDRFLKRCREDVVKIGLCFEQPVEIIEDVDVYDVGLDYCITPEKVFVFGKG